MRGFFQLNILTKANGKDVRKNYCIVTHSGKEKKPSIKLYPADTVPKKVLRDQDVIRQLLHKSSDNPQIQEFFKTKHLGASSGIAMVVLYCICITIRAVFEHGTKHFAVHYLSNNSISMPDDLFVETEVGLDISSVKYEHSLGSAFVFLRGVKRKIDAFYKEGLEESSAFARQLFTKSSIMPKKQGLFYSLREVIEVSESDQQIALSLVREEYIHLLIRELRTNTVSIVSYSILRYLYRYKFVLFSTIVHHLRSTPEELTFCERMHAKSIADSFLEQHARQEGYQAPKEKRSEKKVMGMSKKGKDFKQYHEQETWLPETVADEFTKQSVLSSLGMMKKAAIYSTDSYAHRFCSAHSNHEPTSFENIVLHTIVNLKPELKNAFIMSKFYNRSHEEIAECMQVTVRTVHRYITIASAKLFNQFINKDQIFGTLFTSFTAKQVENESIITWGVAELVGKAARRERSQHKVEHYPEEA